MKQTLILLTLLVVAACDVIIVEPQYNSRDALLGTYRVEEYSETYNASTYYFITISRAGGGNEVYFENFYNADIRVKASLNGNKLTIWRQMRDGFDIEGTGTVFGSTISLNYRVKDTYYDDPTDFCVTEAWQEW